MRYPLRYGGKSQLIVQQEPAAGLEPTTSALRKRPLAIRARWQRAVYRHRTGTLRLTKAALSHLRFDGTPDTLSPVLRLASQPVGKPQPRCRAPQEGLEPPTPSSEDWRSVR